jgi:Nucleotidyl transferase AbiEii toxin, Type IV TA system
MRLISKEQQIAEKLHAYTLPRSTPNSRVKDLVDLLLLIRTGDVRQAQLAEAVRMTFDRRKTHVVPPTLVPPPESWETQFRELAAECGLSSGLAESFVEVKSFFEHPLRSGE